MSEPKSWLVRPNPTGTAYVVDEKGKEIAFCQMEEDANRIANVSECLRKAIQMASICYDWDLYEVEIDGEMVSVLDLGKEFERSLKGSK